MANCNDLPDKMKELVVEEKKNEKNWNNLPFEMKELVVKEMTIETRTRLKLCSKSDKYLVESVPMSFDSLDCEVNERDEMFSVSVKLGSNKCKMPALDLVMGTCIGTFFILKSKRRVEQFLCSSEEGKIIGLQMFESIVFNGNLRFNSVKVHIDCPDLFDDSEFTIHTKHIDISAPKQQVIQWLKNVAAGVKAVQANTNLACLEKLEGIGNIPVIINAKKFQTSSASDINDEQLANFNCTSIIIDGKSNITGKGINQLIKKAIVNDYPKETSIQIYVNSSDLFETWKDIIEGLDVEVTDSRDRIVFNGLEFGHREGRIGMKDGKWMDVSLKAAHSGYKFQIEVYQ